MDPISVLRFAFLAYQLLPDWEIDNPFKGKAAPAVPGANMANGKEWLDRLKENMAKLNLTNSAVASVIPRLETKVSVTVYGQPHAKRQDLLWFAYAVAFGVLKRRLAQGAGALLPPSSSILASISLDKKRVYVELNYGASPLLNFTNAAIGQGLGFLAGFDRLADSLPVLNAIPDEIIGGDFYGLNAVEQTVFGIPPTLRAAGTVVLTDRPKLPSPAPGGDKLSRGLLEGLIWESLMEPPHLINHQGNPRLKEDRPDFKQPGSPGSYFSGKDGVPAPVVNQSPEPQWKKFWSDRGYKTPEDAG